MITPLVTLLESEYDIKDPVEELAGFYSNRLFLTKDYFIKVTTNEIPTPLYAARLEVVGQLHGLVPVIHRTRSGTLFVDDGEHYIEVHTRIHGIHNSCSSSMSLAHIEQTASSIAHLHSSLDNLKSPAAKLIQSVAGEHFQRAFDHQLADELREYVHLVRNIPYSPLRDYMQSELPILLEKIPHLKPSPEEQGIVHGDLHDLQLLFGEDGRLKCIADWESMHGRSRSFELGFMLDRLSSDTQKLYYDDSIPIQRFRHKPEAIESFLQMYAHTWSLPDANSMMDEVLIEAMGRAAGFLKDIFSHEAVNYQILYRHLRIQNIGRIEEMRQYL